MKLLFLSLLLFPPFANAEFMAWHLVKTPTKHKSVSYGSYYAGCMDGGIKLEDKGTGYIQKGVHDNREYGQPELINYIEKLGRKVHGDMGRTLIVADLSNARGGPAPIGSSLHQSHQNGLDADIWLRSAKADENAAKIKQVSMLNKKKTGINPKYWDEETIAMLKDAASFAEVDRIFINPVIKRELCANYAKAPWMSKLRSWWGHSSHFHVRLKCPKNSRNCVPQAAVTKGDGCAKELDWWFSEEATSGKTWEPRKYPELPKECAGVFSKKVK